MSPLTTGMSLAETAAAAVAQRGRKKKKEKDGEQDADVCSHDAKFVKRLPSFIFGRRFFVASSQEIHF